MLKVGGKKVVIMTWDTFFFEPCMTKELPYCFFPKRLCYHSVIWEFSFYISLSMFGMNNTIWSCHDYKQRIWCKPSPCKLCKLQSESLDQHSKGMGDWVILQAGPAFRLSNHNFANPPSHLSAPLPLDVDMMVQIEVFIICTERLVCTWYIPITLLMSILIWMPARHARAIS